MTYFIQTSKKASWKKTGDITFYFYCLSERKREREKERKRERENERKREEIFNTCVRQGGSFYLSFFKNSF